MGDRLYRSRDDRMLAGVAGGLAEMWGADPALVRIIWALLVIFTGGIALVVYIVMAIVVPERPPGFDAATPGSTGAGSGAAWGTEPGMGAAPSYAAATPRPRPARDPADRARVGFIGGLVLIGLGAIFLVRELLPAFDFDLVWPAFLIGLGVVLLVVALVPNRRSG